MRLWACTTLVCVLMAAACRNSDPPLKALTGATLLDGIGQTVMDAVVIVSGNDIQAVGSRPGVSIPAGAAEIKLNGKFIVPGLIDVHGQLSSDSAKAADELHGFLKAGFTSVGLVDGGPPAKQAAPRILPTGTRTADFAGAMISSGGNSPEEAFRKIDRMAQAGIAPEKILIAATRNGAAWLQQSRLGVLAQGRKADLLVLSADPSRDIHNLRRLERVMVDGHWVK
ncbi:MAG: amidohydrolase [Bryobacterales bacterium]|nr:amidohydrolase [Bryobacterales bacterium]